MKAIILDLDDTIFQTKSMGTKMFDPFFDHLKTKLRTSFNAETLTNIQEDLWRMPFEFVIRNYKIPLEAMMESINVLENLKLDLKISVFKDYDVIKKLQAKKFLVTTGLTTLQNAKIRALGIENDFEKIVINDSLKEANTKEDIFNALKIEYNLIPEKTYVIGDNPDAEIKAGNALNFTTIQILRGYVSKGTNARFYINSFDELEAILN